jgi:acyl-coenzyme A synthetase/AMP-(fatty) acid ligase
VKRRGHRIELDEVEHGLASHPDIREAAVVAVTSPDGGVQITAFVVFEAGRRRTTVDLKAHCATRLPVSMSPDRFVERQHLPRTSTGKVHYQALLASEDLKAAS